MRISVRQTVTYLLVAALMATGFSRVAVSAERTHAPTFETNQMAGGHHHGHHSHAMDSSDVGTWQCLKYCVEHAPDTGFIMIASALAIGPLEQFGLIHGSDFKINIANLESSHRIWPRGPPQRAHQFVPRKRHDILLQTARFRI